MNKFKSSIIYIMIKNKYYILIILLLFLFLIGLFYSYKSYQIYSIKNTIKNSISKIIISNNILENIVINDKTNYELSFNDSNINLSLTNQDKKINYYYINNVWFTNAPDFYSEQYKFIKLNKSDLSNTNEQSIKDYFGWLKKFNKDLFYSLIEKTTKKGIIKDSNGYYNINIYSNYKDTITKILSKNDYNDINSLITEWLKSNNITNINVVIKDNKITTNIFYNDKQNNKNEIQYIIKSDYKQDTIDINKNNTLNIEDITK
jgi:predicted metal-dependent hydrolase